MMWVSFKRRYITSDIDYIMQPGSSKKKVGNYIVELNKVLGAGQYGRVCVATEKSTHAIAAVKIIDKKQSL